MYWDNREDYRVTCLMESISLSWVNFECIIFKEDNKRSTIAYYSIHILSLLCHLWVFRELVTSLLNLSCISSELYFYSFVVDNLMGYINALDELQELMHDFIKIVIRMRFAFEYWYSFNKVLGEIICRSLFYERFAQWIWHWSYVRLFPFRDHMQSNPY